MQQLRLMSPTRGARWRALWAWALASLLLFQGLGLTHRVLHAGLGGGVPALEQTATASSADAGKTWDGPTFSHEAGSADCRLLDQLAQGLGLGTDAPVAVVLASLAAEPAYRAVLAVLAPQWRQAARGPPRG